MDTAMWITIALLAPFWWALGLLVLALLGDVLPALHAPVSRLLDRMEGRDDPTEAAVS